MNKEKFTPGNWQFKEQGDANEYCMITNENRWVAGFRLNGEQWHDEQLANVRLMSAAKDMYEALRGFIHSVEHEGVISGRVTDAVRNAKSALNKANPKP